MLEAGAEDRGLSLEPAEGLGMEPGAGQGREIEPGGLWDDVWNQRRAEDGGWRTLDSLSLTFLSRSVGTGTSPIQRASRKQDLACKKYSTHVSCLGCYCLL